MILCCKHCGESNLDLLCKDNKRKSGKRRICKKCHANYNKINNLKRKNKIQTTGKIYYLKTKEKLLTNEDFQIKNFCLKFKNRKRLNFSKKIELNILIQKCKEGKEKFPYMTFYNHKKLAFRASVDRIDSSKDYTKENIQIIPLWLNSGKLDMSMDDFHLLITNYYEKFLSKI